MIGTGWSRRWRPIAGCSRPDPWRMAGVRGRPRPRATTGARTMRRRVRPSAAGSPVVGIRPGASPSTPTALPSSIRTSSTRTRGTIRAPAACAATRWARIPERFVPRRQPNGQLPQSPQLVAFRRLAAASQPRAAAPWRIAASFGGIDRRLGRPRARARSPRRPASHAGVGQAFDAVLAAPLLADPGGCREARHPVDERPAADRGARQASSPSHPRSPGGRGSGTAGRTRPARRSASTPRRRTAPPRGRRRTGRPGRARRRRRRRPHRTRRRPRPLR